MRDVGTHADHIRGEIAEEDNVGGEILDRLAREADHHAGSGDVTEALERPQTRDAPVKGTFGRMDRRVELSVARLDAQEIAHRPGVLPATVDVLGLFPETERHLESAARREIYMLAPVVFLVLPVTVVFAFYPGLVGLRLTAP